VRSITNHATGRLGAAIAGAFAGAGWETVCVCGQGAAAPAGIQPIYVSGVKSLLDTLEAQLSGRKFDCVIHSMAVSDYTPRAILDIDAMARDIADALKGREISEKIIREAVLNCGNPPGSGKISSKTPYMALMLEQTPKVIGRIKEIQSDTILVGFKLLSGVPEEELIRAAMELMIKNSCDYVLANDLADIQGGAHKAVLLGKAGILDRAGSKEEIAKLIYSRVSQGGML
jgi:phosphopantothenate-cysteine ligase